MQTHRISRSGLWVGLGFFFFLGLVAGKAMAQDLEATITYERRNTTNGFDLVVLNSSPAEIIDQVTVTMQNGLEFDHSSGNPTPDIGVNNDDIKSAGLTWSTNLATGEMLQESGDVDGNAVPQEILATVNFTSAGARSVTLQPSGVTDQWRGIVSETTAPPGPIINGQATATLSWVRPTEREDNSPLLASDIAGYVLYWGTSSGVGNCGLRPGTLLDPCYGNALQLPDGALETTPLTLSLSGDTTVYFAMIAYTTLEDGSPGLSQYSNEVPRVFTVEIQLPPEPLPGAPEQLDVTMQVTCTTDQVNVTCSFTVN